MGRGVPPQVRHPPIAFRLYDIGLCAHFDVLITAEQVGTHEHHDQDAAAFIQQAFSIPGRSDQGSMRRIRPGGLTPESVHTRTQMRTLSLELVQVGVFLTAIVFLQGPLLGADSFILPKALLLVLIATVAASASVLDGKSYTVERSDLLLALFLLLSFVSASAAVNGWYAVTATGTLFASVLLFWTSRSLSHAGLRNALLYAAVGAIGFIAATALVEAYTSLQLSIRLPGGTLGNRNRMAHLLVIGSPTLAYLCARERSRWMLGLLLAAGALTDAALVLSRARGAWLAGMAALAVTGMLLLLRRASNHPLPRPRAVRQLCALVLVVIAGGVAAATIPNRLAWASASPYRDSVTTLLEYRAGSGAGRLTEYSNTLRMIADHPFLGVGPGNWRIEYPNYASAGDPSIEPGYLPVRRYPQSEWIGATAERGIPAMILAGLAAGIFVCRWSRSVLRERLRRRAACGFVGVVTMSAVALVGLVDPVIQTPVAGFVVPVLLGAFATRPSRIHVVTPPPSLRVALLIAVASAGLIFSSYWAREVWAATLYARNPTVQSIERAAQIAPGDYRVRFLAGATLAQRGDCTGALPHIAAARRLYPTAPAAIDLEILCLAFEPSEAASASIASPLD